ncbi:MAG: autotransporter outer membrane beta-barrel domain-containing protein [Alphaproteobacteria bacterium]|nr:autotransporter outer membrane beta-barrel domain-containing protein [Alphaproteobacteria bacterium]
MKYSKNAITQLKRQYKSVLLKCLAINAALFIGVALNAAPVMAEEITYDIAEGETQKGDLFELNDGVVNNGTIEAKKSILNEDGVFTNKGNIIAGQLVNWYGKFFNNGTINLQEYIPESEDEDSGPSRPEVINDDGIFYNGAKLIAEDDIHSIKATESGTIYGDVTNFGDFYNLGTIEGRVTNHEVFYNGVEISRPLPSKPIIASVNTMQAVSADISSVKEKEEKVPEHKGYAGAEIKGNVFNSGMLVNDGSITGSIFNVASFGNGFEPVFGTLTLTAFKEASISGGNIFNGGEFTNGGSIDANVIFSRGGINNGFEFYRIGEVLDGEAMPEDIIFGPEASITAKKIYNDDIIANAGYIGGDLININEEALLLLAGGTLEGSISSEFIDEDGRDSLLQEYFADFEDIINSKSTSEPMAVKSEITVEETGAAENQLNGLVASIYGDNSITGSVGAYALGVYAGSSLKVGGDIKVNEIGVLGTPEFAGMEPQAVSDENSRYIPETGGRLDIGSNKAEAISAYFEKDTTLALTVESDTTFGQMTAGEFMVEDGAKLEVTVMPGFSEIGKEYELPLLIQDESLREEEDDEVSSMEPLDAGEDTSEENTGVSNFSDNYIDGSEEAEELVADESGVAKNSMFEIKRGEEEGVYVITQLKTAQEIIEEPEEPVKPVEPSVEPEPVPAPSEKTLELGEMAKAWLDSGAMTTPASLEMQEELAKLAQKSTTPQAKAQFKGALKALAPNDAPVAQAMSAAIMGRIFGGIGAHLSKPKSGLASGDALNGVSAWGSTYYGNAKLDDRADEVYGFDADSKGITAGVDKQVTSAVKLGFGLQYDKSDINAFKRDVDVETAAAFVYGEYRPSNWYVSGVAAYGRSDYDEKKFAGDKIVKANYDADLFGLQALTGYDVLTRYADVTPNAGLRYNYIKRHGYVDGAGQDISGSNSDILTGVAGLKVAKNFGGFRPSAYVNFTYDFVSDRDSAVVNLTNGASYHVSGKRLNQFGTEAGAAIEYNCGGWSVAASYDYAGRRHFNSHTGMLTAKYSF